MIEGILIGAILMLWTFGGLIYVFALDVFGRRDYEKPYPFTWKDYAVGGPLVWLMIFGDRIFGKRK